MSADSEAAPPQRGVRAPTPKRERRRNSWQTHAKRLLQGEMARRGVTYKGLARLLESDDSEASLTTKVNRGAFSAAWFLKALRVIGTETLDISHLPKGD